MWWYGNSIIIIVAYPWGASTSLKEVETKCQTFYQLGCNCALWWHVPWKIIFQSLLAVITAPSSLHVIKEHQHCSRKRGKGISAKQSQLGVAEFCDSTLEYVPSNPWWMWSYGNSNAIIIAYIWGAFTLLNKVETKCQSSYQLGCNCASWWRVPRGITVGSLLAVMTAPLSLHVIEEHQNCSRRRGKEIYQAISACRDWSLWQQVGECAVQSLIDVMVWIFHHHHHSISLRSINIAEGSIDKVSVQLPTWLQICFMTACTTRYHHLILARCDDSSIVIVCHGGA